MARYDAAVVNGTVVDRYLGALRSDIGSRGGRVAALTGAISSSQAESVVDARGKVVLPGAVDSHFHLGIYRDLAQDARSETASALVGGVTTVVSYFRTGRHYLNKSGPSREFFPGALAATAGQAWTDYAYHIAVMTADQLDEVDWLVGGAGGGSVQLLIFHKGPD